MNSGRWEYQLEITLSYPSLMPCHCPLFFHISDHLFVFLEAANENEMMEFGDFVKVDCFSCNIYCLLALYKFIFIIISHTLSCCLFPF